MIVERRNKGCIFCGGKNDLKSNRIEPIGDWVWDSGKWQDVMRHLTIKDGM